MPNYTYRCQKCGHEFTRFQRITEEPLTCCCEECGGPVKRLIGAGAGLVFKGDGFYITDYKRKQTGQGGKKRPPAPKADKSGGKKEANNVSRSDPAPSADAGKKKDAGK